MYNDIFHLHSKLLKALSHPKRLEIVHLLRDQKLDVSQMQNMLGLRQANLSQHLQVLRAAKVVSAKKAGKHVVYQLAHANYIQVNDLVREILIDQTLDKNRMDELSLSMKELVPLVIDPICGMRLSPRTAAFAIKYQNQQYYFCAEGCKTSFLKDPSEYVK